MPNELKLLAITSLPTVGNAGLKNILNIIGDKTIPIPSLIACGLGNMHGHQKIEVQFKETLLTSLQIAKAHHYKLIIYVGYLHNKEQIDIIKDLVIEFKEIIDTIIVDPVCGDHNKAYVDASIIDNFYKLLAVADYTLPNETELRILTGYDFDTNIDTLITSFKEKFPALNLVVTSVLQNQEYYIYLVENNIQNQLHFDKINANFSGTGDLFAALFIKFMFFENESANEAILKTANYISKLIAYNTYFDRKSYDLAILQSLNNTYSKGNLFYVIGPSGVGKDTLMDIAKQRLKNSNVVFAQRYITRAKNAGGETHIEISKQDFIEKTKENFFCLWWQSHDNYYGISSNINMLLDNGFNVVVNGSRGYYEEALKVYSDIKTVLITAQEATIKERLLKRGRESTEEIEKRIERSRSFNNKFKNNDSIIRLSNDGKLKDSSDDFVKVLSKK